jgi:hypothetical protein
MPNNSPFQFKPLQNAFFDIGGAHVGILEQETNFLAGSLLKVIVTGASGCSHFLLKNREIYGQRGFQVNSILSEDNSSTTEDEDVSLLSPPQLSGRLVGKLVASALFSGISHADVTAKNKKVIILSFF